MSCVDPPHPIGKCLRAVLRIGLLWHRPPLYVPATAVCTHIRCFTYSPSPHAPTPPSNSLFVAPATAACAFFSYPDLLSRRPPFTSCLLPSSPPLPPRCAVPLNLAEVQLFGAGGVQLSRDTLQFTLSSTYLW